MYVRGPTVSRLPRTPARIYIMEAIVLADVKRGGEGGEGGRSRSRESEGGRASCKHRSRTEEAFDLKRSTVSIALK